MPPSMIRPVDSEYGEYYRRYTALVPDGDVLIHLEQSGRDLRTMIEQLDETALLSRYAEGKWSVKEVLIHLMDCERVFLFRALWFARGDHTPLPGFDEDEWARNSEADGMSKEALIRQHEVIREQTLRFYSTLPDSAWEHRGTANDRSASVRSLAWILAGHEIHHMSILRERYL